MSAVRLSSSPAHEEVFRRHKAKRTFHDVPDNKWPLSTLYYDAGSMAFRVPQVVLSGLYIIIYGTGSGPRMLLTHFTYIVPIDSGLITT